jgi:hypothetical protein
VTAALTTSPVRAMSRGDTITSTNSKKKSVPRLMRGPVTLPAFSRGTDDPSGGFLYDQLP